MACAPVGSAPDADAPSPAAKALGLAGAGLWKRDPGDGPLRVPSHWLLTVTLAGSTLRVVDAREVPGRLPVHAAPLDAWRVLVQSPDGTPVAAVPLSAPAPLRAELSRPDGTVEAYRFDARPRTFAIRLPTAPEGLTVRLFAPEDHPDVAAATTAEGTWRERARVTVAEATP